jgi:hypothetical protein
MALVVQVLSVGDQATSPLAVRGDTIAAA